MPQEFKVKNGLIVDLGGATITGSVIATGGFTGSLQGTASNALTASFIDTASTNAFVQGGNSFGATALLGTNNNQSLAFETSGSTRMFISSSGDIGIGTNTPISKFTIQTSGSVQSAQPIISAVSGSTFAGWLIYTGSSERVRYAWSTGDGAYVYTTTTDPFTVFTNNTRALRIDSSQNVGIGTTTPSYRLDVSGSGNFTANLTVTGSTTLRNGQTTIQGAGATSATTALRVENSNASASFVVRDNGSVGIGTATPSAPLEVVGNMIVSGGQTIRNSGGTTYFDSSGYGGGRIYGSYNYLNGEIYILPSGSNNSNFFFSPNNGMSIGGLTIGGTTGSPPAYGLAVSGSIGIGTRVPITQLDVSGSGRFTSNLTVTGSLIAPSITGSLQGTASYATQALSASWAPSVASNPFPFTGSAIISGSLTITGSFDVGVPGTNSPRITSVGTLNRGDIVSVDWSNRNLIDTSTTSSIDWESRALYDTTGVISVDWTNRQLWTPNGIPALSYPDDIASISEIYHQQNTSNTVEGESLSNTLLSYSGQAIRTTITGSAIDGNIVYLDTDGTWKTVNQTTVTSTKMLGIKLSSTFVLLEGDVVLEASSMIKTPVYGAPLYIWEGGTVLSSDIPTSGYVRILGHCYYQNTGTNTNWIVKFRPSNDWYEI